MANCEDSLRYDFPAAISLMIQPHISPSFLIARHVNQHGRELCQEDFDYAQLRESKDTRYMGDREKESELFPSGYLDMIGQAATKETVSQVERSRSRISGYNSTEGKKLSVRRQIKTLSFLHVKE